MFCIIWQACWNSTRRSRVRYQGVLNEKWIVSVDIQMLHFALVMKFHGYVFVTEKQVSDIFWLIFSSEIPLEYHVHPKIRLVLKSLLAHRNNPRDEYIAVQRHAHHNLQ